MRSILAKQTQTEPTIVFRVVSYFITALSLRFSAVICFTAATSSHGYPLFVLYCSSNVQERKTELEEDERKGAIVHAPNDPQHVAQQEEPESPIAFELFLRANHPGRNNRNNHCGPLDRVNYVSLHLRVLVPICSIRDLRIDHFISCETLCGVVVANVL